MTSSMNTVLLIGASGGLGEAAALRLHSMGKKVIITGRRTERLDAIAKANPGIETYVFDMSDIPALPGHVDQIFSRFPDIDTVWVNGGLAQLVDLLDQTSIADERILFQLNVNLAAPIILARHVIPRLLEAGKETNFLATSSGIAITPFFSFPTYSAEKAGLHAYMVSIRQQLKDTNVNIIEIVPPQVKTEFDKDLPEGHATKGGSAMTIKDWEEETFSALNNTPAKELREVGAGTAVDRVAAWREAIGAWMAKMGMTAA